MPNLRFENESHSEENDPVLCCLYEVEEAVREVPRLLSDLDPPDVEEGGRLGPGVVQDVVGVDHDPADVGQQLGGGRTVRESDRQQTV